MIKIPLSRPDITEKETRAVLETLKTPQLSLGPRLREFEQRIAEYTGVKYAVAVNSGTSALHLIIRAMGVTEGDEVITTPFSFIASANCVLFEKAKPVFVDIDPLTLNMAPDLIEKKITGRTKAILAVDVFGHPAEWGRLEEIAGKHGLRLIEDSCEALGSEYNGRKTGSFGNAGAFAFYPNKQITTGEGGIIVTGNKRISELCESMRNQGRSPGDGWLGHTILGYNYRISEINCALGIAQMGRIDEILAKRAEVADIYNSRLKEIDDIDTPHISSRGIKISWFVYVVRLKENFSRAQRDMILAGLRAEGIECGDYFPPIHLQPLYRGISGYREGDFPVAESVSERTIALPFYNNLSEEQIEYVVRTLKQVIFEVSKGREIRC